MGSRLTHVRRLSATLWAGVVAGVVATASPGATHTPAGRQASKAPAGDCVTIGTPKPGVGYTYSHVTSTGPSSEYTQYWESLSPRRDRQAHRDGRRTHRDRDADPDQIGD
jgi:hypothetical protein